MARKPTTVTLSIQIEYRHRLYLDRKKGELVNSDHLQDIPGAITDDAVVRQLFDAWMALDQGSNLEEKG